MTDPRPRRRANLLAIPAALALGACSTASHGEVAARGTATVDYAGSLTGLVQTTLQPAFEQQTGDSFVGKGAGSTLIAQGILDGELSPGVFISIGKKAITSLWPSRSHFVLTLATDPLVVAYSPKSRYASQLDAIRSGAKPLSALFRLMETPGFRLGRTDPTQDPQGAFFILMFELATKELHLPVRTPERILGVSATDPVGNTTQVVDEDSLATDIASGSVDAGSDFLTEARQFHLDYITLGPSLDFADPAQGARYATVTLHLPAGPFQGGLITLDATYVLPAAGEHRAAADATADEQFLAFLLSGKGRSELRAAGYVLSKPTVALAPGFRSASAALPRAVATAFARLDGRVVAP
jgi:molybdate/tungstate transport system substrate-binding protein